ncbi:hypothetical protein HaLaN_03801, partial [Haematococcus lacustris]
MFDLGT